MSGGSKAVSHCGICNRRTFHRKIYTNTTVTKVCKVCGKRTTEPKNPPFLPKYKKDWPL